MVTKLAKSFGISDSPKVLATFATLPGPTIEKQWALSREQLPELFLSDERQLQTRARSRSCKKLRERHDFSEVL